MNQFDVSVIIPVYNCEKLIKDSVKSILNQDYNDLSKIQIVLVDDGSTDNSLKVCNELKNDIKELTIDVITGPNGGVSAARNRGMDAALGKYILFLDSDDFISKNALKSLVEFFEEHFEEIDIATYSFYKYTQNTKKKKKYVRNDIFTRGTDVYDLDGEDYHIVQPSINVFIKNYYEENIKFDTTMQYHEDTLFSTMIMMKKKKMGFVEEARYYYRKYEGQVTDIKSNARYNYDDMMKLFDYCIENYTKFNGELEKNIQALFLHVIRSKIFGKIQNLFPFFDNEEETKEAKQRIIEILNKISDEVIINDVNTDIYHKMFFLQLKDTKFNTSINKDNLLTITSRGNEVCVIDEIELVYSRIKVKNGKIKLMAHLRSPIFWIKRPYLFIQYTDIEGNEKEEKIGLKKTNHELYKTNERVAKFYGFEYEIDLKNVKSFEFKVKIDENVMKVNTSFEYWTPFNKKIKSYKVYDGKIRLQYKKNKFIVTKPGLKTRIKDKINAIKRYAKIDYKINIYRALTRKSKKKIWLYNDKAGVYDNGYLQFKHDISIKDGIKRYYVFDGKLDENKFDAKERKYVIKLGSVKHKLLFLKSDKILSSFVNTQHYSPFDKKLKYYKDIFRFDLIYLQYGILQATAIKKYSKEFTPIDKIVISSKFEENNFIENYNYSKNDLIKCGMPRFDEINKDTEIENKIIFAPSWREYLIGEAVNKKRKIDINRFINSDYYKKIVEFLKNERLQNILKEKNIVIDLKLHPIFEPYSVCFEEIKNDNINIITGNINLRKYKAFITDFSSYQFDFVKLIRPICYFIPDIKEFKAGLHSYKELDLKYEDAFGKLCLTSDELVDETIKIIKDDFKLEKDYKKRMENFFFKIDNCKDTLYRLLKED